MWQQTGMANGTAESSQTEPQAGSRKRIFFPLSNKKVSANTHTTNFPEELEAISKFQREMFIISLWSWLTINTDIKEKNASKITWLLLPLVAQLRLFLKYRLGLPATPAPTPHAALSLVWFCVFSIPWDRKQPARIAAINGLSWCWSTLHGG